MTQFKITQMDRNIVDGFVTTVHWTASQVDGDFSASLYNTVSFTEEESMNLIPYEDLTEEIVIGWVQTSLGVEGVAAVDAALTERIAEQKAPKTASGTPWSN
jgi:hypothetical protein